MLAVAVQLSEVDGVVTGCPATSTLGRVSGLTASG